MSKEFYDETEMRFEERTKELLSALPPYVSGFAESLGGRSRKARTIFAYVNDVKQFLEYELSAVPALYEKKAKEIPIEILSAIKTEDIEEYRKYLKRNRFLADSSLKRMFASLSLFFSFLTTRKHIPENPMDAFEAPELKRKSKQRVIALDSDYSSALLSGILRNDRYKNSWYEFKGVKYSDLEGIMRETGLKPDKIKAYISEHKHLSASEAISSLSGHPITEGYEIIDAPEQVRERREKTIKRDYTIIRFILSTGLRVSELVGLDLKDIRWDEGSVIIIGKGGDEREVFFGKEAKTALFDYVFGDGGRLGLIGKKRSEAVFLSRWGGRMSVSGVEKMVKEYVQTYLEEYPDKDLFSPHKLRATCASRILKQTGNIEQVATQLGNGIGVAAEFYARLSREEKMRRNQELDESDW